MDNLNCIMPNNKKIQLVVVIVERDMSGEVIDAAKAGGAEGATVLYGRGSGIHENEKFFGITIEPEKEIVLVLIDAEIRNRVLCSIKERIDIDRPGNGVAFVIDVSKVIGIPHLNMMVNADDEKSAYGEA